MGLRQRSEKLESGSNHFAKAFFMSAPHTDAQPHDAVESVVPMMPVILPLAGAVLIFLLAFIAVSMA
jgi:hypothetical protein